MKQSISHNSTSKGNLRFREILKLRPDLLDEVSDSQIFNGIAHQLYILRKQKGLTQKELADEIELKQSHISRWEKAGYQGYKIKVLSKLARTLGGKLEVNLIPQMNTFNVELKIQDNTIYPNNIVHTHIESLTMPVSIFLDQFKKGDSYVTEIK